MVAAFLELKRFDVTRLFPLCWLQLWNWWLGIIFLRNVCHNFDLTAESCVVASMLLWMRRYLLIFYNSLIKVNISYLSGNFYSSWTERYARSRLGTLKLLFSFRFIFGIFVYFFSGMWCNEFRRDFAKDFLQSLHWNAKHGHALLVQGSSWQKFELDFFLYLFFV